MKKKNKLNSETSKIHKKNISGKNKVSPSFNLKKEMKDFLIGEEGKITKKDILKMGITLAALDGLFSPHEATPQTHSSSFDQSLGTQGGHSSHTSHSSHGSHGAHGSHGSHGATWC